MTNMVGEPRGFVGSSMEARGPLGPPHRDPDDPDEDSHKPEAKSASATVELKTH